MTHGKISIWQKWWPLSSYNTARGTINKFIEKGDFGGLQQYHATTLLNGGVDLAAFTSDVIEDIVHQMYDAKAFSTLGSFAAECAKLSSHDDACKKSFLEEADEEMCIGNYEGLSEAIDGICANGDTPLSSLDMLNVMMGKVIADIIDSQLEIDSTLYHAATDLLDALFRKSGRIAPQAVIKALRPWEEDDDTKDMAPEVLEIAKRSNVLESIPADAVQALLDYYMAEGMPETAMEVYDIAVDGGYEHLRGITPDLEKYSLVSFPTGEENHSVLMLRLHEVRSDLMFSAETDEFYNVNMHELLDDLSHRPEYHNPHAERSGPEMVADLTALFQHMATQTWGEAARVARDVLPQIEEWYNDMGWDYLPVTIAPK